MRSSGAGRSGQPSEDERCARRYGSGPAHRCTHRVQGIGQAGHELRLHELSLAVLELALLLHGERGGLHAEVLQLVGACLQLLQVRGAALQHRASVGNTGTLDLEVGQALNLVEGQRIGGLRGGMAGNADTSLAPLAPASRITASAARGHTPWTSRPMSSLAVASEERSDVPLAARGRSCAAAPAPQIALARTPATRADAATAAAATWPKLACALHTTAVHLQPGGLIHHDGLDAASRSGRRGAAAPEASNAHRELERAALAGTRALLSIILATGSACRCEGAEGDLGCGPVRGCGHLQPGLDARIGTRSLRRVVALNLSLRTTPAYGSTSN